MKRTTRTNVRNLEKLSTFSLLFFCICVPDALKRVILGVQNRNLEMSVNRPLIFFVDV